MKKYAYVQFGNHNGGVNSKEYAYNCGATLSRVLQEGDTVLVDARGELEIAVVHRLSTECEYEGATKEVLALVESNQDYISKIDFKKS